MVGSLSHHYNITVYSRTIFCHHPPAAVALLKDQAFYQDRTLQHDPRCFRLGGKPAVKLGLLIISLLYGSLAWLREVKPSWTAELLSNSHSSSLTTALSRGALSQKAGPVVGSKYCRERTRTIMPLQRRDLCSFRRALYNYVEIYLNGRHHLGSRLLVPPGFHSLVVSADFHCITRGY